MSGNNVPSLEERERARRCLAQRTEGRTWSEIAENEGYTDESGARHAVSRLVDRVEADDVADYRALELARLDEVHRAFWPAAIGGDPKAAEIVLKICDRRVRLLGLAQPERFVVTANSIGSDEEFVDTVMTLFAEIAKAEAANKAEKAENDSDEPWANIGD